jgi:hypothetical protein
MLIALRQGTTLPVTEKYPVLKGHRFSRAANATKTVAGFSP